jgi:hypothetical protein
LFQNGELWLATNKMIVKERGGRPSWWPIPFIPALGLEEMFFDKARSALAFASQHLGLTFPCEIAMGIIGTADVNLAITTDEIQPIRRPKIIHRERLADSSDVTVNGALLAFFEQIYDATGFPRAPSLFTFPPNRPHG